MLLPTPGAESSSQSSVGMNITAEVTPQIGISTHIAAGGAAEGVGQQRERIQERRQHKADDLGFDGVIGAQELREPRGEEPDGEPVEEREQQRRSPVSYTHLTLPTMMSV